MRTTPRTVNVVLFDGFELLDVFGPVELLSQVSAKYRINYVAQQTGPVASSQGAEIIALKTLANAQDSDILFVPGGMGTRKLVTDRAFITAIAEAAASAQIIASVCTGAGLLAAAGLLDGYRATSNKKAFEWATGWGKDVTWVPKARWVHDRNRWTSGGVAAGMDMTAALIASLDGDKTAQRAARDIELEVHTDPDWDPFAKYYGLEDKSW